jgi:uncharacterized phage-associated protein
MELHVVKLIQAAGVLLRQERREQMGYMRLLKLLYIANRESLKETGALIIADRFVAMKHGPVLSHTLDVVKGQDFRSPDWDHFVRRDGYKIFLEKESEPGNSELSKYDIRKLEEVSRRFADTSDWDLVEHTHTFPEWKRNDPGDSSKLIPLEHILEGVGMDRKDAAEVLEALKQEAALRRFVASTEKV